MNLNLIHQHKKGLFNVFQTETTNIRNLNFSQFLAETRIPLPSAAEQKRISSQVTVLLAKISRARDHLSRVPVILKRFRQAVLAAACSGRLTEDWRTQNASMRDDLLDSAMGAGDEISLRCRMAGDGKSWG